MPRDGFVHLGILPSDFFPLFLASIVMTIALAHRVNRMRIAACRDILQAAVMVACVAMIHPGDAARAQDPPTETSSDRFISNVRQITFEGRRAGEGYFSADGQKMVFQSERDPANPFYQIFLTDLGTGDVRRISPGFGKTTCAWIHPSGSKVLFASTQDDPKAADKQREEIELRQSGQQRRYAWDYDPNYELYEFDLQTENYRRLTNATGYDAEGSYSPDGSEIVFASNRRAYDGSMTETQKERFAIDPAVMIDLYRMNADGSDVRRLTDAFGYDGGPFFSPDGERICFRRFDPDGATAEIFTIGRDGNDARPLTKLGAMSWAPFFHPSGDYLIFTTNLQGFANFELYLVRADGQGEPVRVTGTEGFDGLPVFLPDGDRLSWTSNRSSGGKSQIFMADWDHDAAVEALGLVSADPKVDLPASEDLQAATSAMSASDADYSAADFMRHVDYLTRPELGGRLTGTEGERRATAYVAAYLDQLGFVPAGENGTYFQRFEFPAGSEVQPSTSLNTAGRTWQLDEDFRPVSFSGDGSFEADEVVFAGYGMQIPPAKEDGSDAYDSYVHLNPAGRFVMVFRDMPQDVAPEVRSRMARYSSPRRKASLARDLGAKGILFVTGPTSKVNDPLIRFDRGVSQAGVSIAALSITDELARSILKGSGETLESLQKSLDGGDMQMGFSVSTESLSAEVAIERRRGQGRNVVARLPANRDADAASVGFPLVMVGAHIDHLGRGGSGNSLARAEEADAIHVGADDNASGVAAMLEIAQAVADQAAGGNLPMRRDLVVAAWSGEELGLFGSQAFVENFHQLFPTAPKAEIDEEQKRIAAAHGMDPGARGLGQSVAAYLNLDMVGRFDEKLIVQGLGSSPNLESMVQRRNVPVGLPLSLDATATRLPTDASAFVARDVPIISMFTGAHEDYHTPRDTAEKLDAENAAKIAKLGGLIVREWLTTEMPPQFELSEGQSDNEETPRVNLRAYLGTIPDYVADGIKGVKLSGVGKGGPAEDAGLQRGDIIVRLADKPIEGIYDYTYAIESLKIGETIEIVVQRGDATKTLRITPGSRD